MLSVMALEVCMHAVDDRAAYFARAISYDDKMFMKWIPGRLKAAKNLIDRGITNLVSTLKNVFLRRRSPWNIFSLWPVLKNITIVNDTSRVV
jgi:hypothetical protein